MNAFKLVAAGLLVPLAASADEVVLHVGSVHAESSYDTGRRVDGDWDWAHFSKTGEFIRRKEPVLRLYNNFNYGVGYAWSNGLAVGVYRNSYYTPSVYVTKTWLTRCGVQNLSCGATVGLASGYNHVNSVGVMPIAAATVRYTVGSWSVNLSGMPRLSDKMSGVAHLYLSKSLTQR